MTVIPDKIPFRVDFAGGWRDVPKHSRKGSRIVNCTIDLFFGEHDIEKGAGLGGSAAAAISRGEDPFKSELDSGVGWQDPAVILETGLCVWRSGREPVLDIKVNPDFIEKMAILFVGGEHITAKLVEKARDYRMIDTAGRLAHGAVMLRVWDDLCIAVNISYRAQIDEGMEELPKFGEKARKYCGAGWGGYALYMFDESQEIPENMIEVHPYMRKWKS
jgi:hypothetical protein